MIKQGLANFFKNLKYVFTPLGTLALGLVFGLSVCIPASAASVNALAENVKTVLSSSDIDLSALGDNIVDAVMSLDWSDPLGSVKVMLSPDWLNAMLNACVDSLMEGAENYASRFGEAIDVFGKEMAGNFSVLAAFLFLGFLGGFYLTKWLVRRNIAKRSVWKFLLASFLESLIAAALTVLSAWLTTIWAVGGILSFVFTFLLFGFLALLEAYVVHGWNKIKFSSVVNLKNIGALFLTNFVIIAVAAVFVTVAVACTNAAVGMFLGTAVFELALIVANLNAEGYVQHRLKAQEETGLSELTA